MRADGDCKTGADREDAVHGASPARAVVFLGVALLAGWGVATLLGQSRQTPWTGVVLAPTVEVRAPQGGNVEQISVTPGQDVHPEMPLGAISEGVLAARIEAQSVAVVHLQEELRQATARAEVEIAWRVREIDAEIFQTRLKAAAYAQDRLTRQVERLALQEYLKSGTQVAGLTLSRDQFTSSNPDDSRLQAILAEDSAGSAIESLDARLELCDRRLADLETTRRQLPNDVRHAHGVGRVETRLAAAQAELSSLRERQDLLQLTAPDYGRVSCIHRAVGEHVAPGETVLELVDLQRRYVDVSVTAADAARLNVGDKVYVSFPHGETGHGRIAAVPLRTDAQARTQVRVEPVGEVWPEVLVGTQVTVSRR